MFVHIKHIVSSFLSQYSYQVQFPWFKFWRITFCQEDLIFLLIFFKTKFYVMPFTPHQVYFYVDYSFQEFSLLIKQKSESSIYLLAKSRKYC